MHFQFTIRRLIALTLAVAIVMAITVSLDAPEFARGVFAVYFLLLAGWAVMRGPAVFAGFATGRSRRRELDQRRADLEREVRETIRSNAPNHAADESRYV